ncbi:FAD-dependent oxidoreductase [Microvirga zambiensis]|uniref:FAD-dependent oxidoreductase n=1 Tax=Microvirga zambiensis TaxID=1402137 RepID=UPI00191EB27D|nr:cyclic nucleotide-binding domain-containing thioredoxin-disulfide reductase [Microvirga zambiensis]
MRDTDIPAGAALDPTDPYAREGQTFPRLSKDQIERIRAYGREDVIVQNDVAYERGQRRVDFFVVLDGELQSFDPTHDGTPIHTYSAGEFTGEVNLFNGRHSLVSVCAVTDTRVVRLHWCDFRRLIASEPDISELVMRAYILRRVGLIRHGQGAVTLFGPSHSGDLMRLKTFLVRNAYPIRVIDTEREEIPSQIMERFGQPLGDSPLVALANGRFLTNPSNLEVADALGLTEEIPSDHIFDVIVVGAGPAGLAAAVYAASEGLSTLVVEASAPGGQAGTSSKIENYLGFPTGISGEALAGRAQAQAQKFGAHLAIARAAVKLECLEKLFEVRMEGEGAARARAIVVATGARYRRLPLEWRERFEGQGIHYAATAMEAQLCAGEEIVIVGGGNSAGQAALFLSSSARHVHMLVRGDGLSESMSDYLVERVERSVKITVHPRCEITALAGDRWLRTVTWAHLQSGQVVTRDIPNLFLMIGAEPNTQWLDGCVKLDAQGFVATGAEVAEWASFSPFATSCTGVFAVGDVRSGSVKRVASAVGEGSVVVHAIHQFLKPA